MTKVIVEGLMLKNRQKHVWAAISRTMVNQAVLSRAMLSRAVLS